MVGNSQSRVKDDIAHSFILLIDIRLTVFDTV